MVQSPSWEANWFATSQEIPRISRNTKVHYRTHKRPSPLSILGQPNPVHITTSNLLEIYSNIIHPSTPRSPQWSLSLRFPHQDPIHPFSFRSIWQIKTTSALVFPSTWITYFVIFCCLTIDVSGLPYFSELSPKHNFRKNYFWCEK